MPLADIPVVHVIGSPRSGTTWLQQMLGSHPKIATPFELDFFSGFAAPWYLNWERHCTGGENWPKPPYWGLPSALTTAEFEQAVGLVVEKIYEAVLAAKPTASIMLEKDPRSSVHVREIVRTVPQAKFIHLVRDGRDVVCSIIRVSRGFGKDWAPNDPGAAAQIWKTYVLAARTAKSLAPGYLEVRYEDLLSEQGPELLRGCLEFCGVDGDPGACAELYDRYRYGDRTKEEVLSGALVWTGEAVRAGAHRGFPAEFIGPAGAGIWQRVFEPEDREVFDRVAGDLLVQLGYEPDRAWAKAEALPSRRRWSLRPVRR